MNTKRLISALVMISACVAPGIMHGADQRPNQDPSYKPPAPAKGFMVPSAERVGLRPEAVDEAGDRFAGMLRRKDQPETPPQTLQSPTPSAPAKADVQRSAAGKLGRFDAALARMLKQPNCVEQVLEFYNDPERAPQDQRAIADYMQRTRHAQEFAQALAKHQAHAQRAVGAAALDATAAEYSQQVLASRDARPQVTARDVQNQERAPQTYEQLNGMSFGELAGLRNDYPRDGRIEQLMAAMTAHAPVPSPAQQAQQQDQGDRPAMRNGYRRNHHQNAANSDMTDEQITSAANLEYLLAVQEAYPNDGRIVQRIKELMPAAAPSPAQRGSPSQAADREAKRGHAAANRGTPVPAPSAPPMQGSAEFDLDAARREAEAVCNIAMLEVLDAQYPRNSLVENALHRCRSKIRDEAIRGPVMFNNLMEKFGENRRVLEIAREAIQRDPSLESQTRAERLALINGILGENPSADRHAAPAGGPLDEVVEDALRQGPPRAAAHHDQPAQHWLMKWINKYSTHVTVVGVICAVLGAMAYKKGMLQR